MKEELLLDGSKWKGEYDWLRWLWKRARELETKPVPKQMPQPQMPLQIPESERLYLSELKDPSKLPKGLAVYEGPRGGRFVDVRQLRQMGIREEEIISPKRPEEAAKLPEFEMPSQLEFDNLVDLIRASDEWDTGRMARENPYVQRHREVFDAIAQIHRAWCSSITMTLTAAHLEERLHRDAGNGRAIRKLNPEYVRNVEEMAREVGGEFIRPTEESLNCLLSFRPISQKIYEAFYGKEATLYRGIGRFESIQLEWQGALDRPLRLTGTVMSFTDSKDVAEAFGQATVSAKVRSDSVLGGWWFIRRPFNFQEREIIVEIPQGGLEVEYVYLGRARTFRKVYNAFKKRSLIVAPPSRGSEEIDIWDVISALDIVPTERETYEVADIARNNPNLFLDFHSAYVGLYEKIPQMPISDKVSKQDLRWLVDRWFERLKPYFDALLEKEDLGSTKDEFLKLMKRAETVYHSLVARYRELTGESVEEKW